MRYQERIYDQADIFVRNKAINNVNMSSDFCIFKSPTFDVEGALKIQYSTVECTLSGYSFATMLTAATSSCFTTATTACYLSTNWNTKVIANGSIVYNEAFYITTDFTGGTPTDSAFINSVAVAYTSLGYSYTLSGNTFTIEKPYGVSNLEVDVCITFNQYPSTFSCPVGFSPTPANDACVKTVTTGATFNGSGVAIVAGDKFSTYGAYGAYFYPSIQNDGALPIYYVGDGSFLKDQSGGTITALNINTLSTFWANPTLLTTSGRLNNAGLSAVTGDYVGFSYCLDIPVAGTYYVGIAADNNCKFTLNGTLLVYFSGSVYDNFKKYSIFPVTLDSGKNIIEMYGENSGAQSAFVAEIYNPISYSILTGATSTASTQANTIFSTVDFIGKNWTLGTSQGYSCPAGYALDGCGTAYTCTKITLTGGTGIVCSGSCTGTCTTVCTETFDGISATTFGVYLVEDTLTSIPVIFNFTGNTSTFTANTTSFKYEVYKFNPDTNIFSSPAVYKSPIIPYNQFSTSNQLYQNIPVNNLSLDGDYLIKGYYEANACTTYSSLLGKTIDTSLYKQGSEYNLYQPELDYYFVAINMADTPTFTQTSPINLSVNSSYPLYQQVLFINNVDTSGYTRTGNTFTLNSTYDGTVLVTKNGYTLANGLDYTLSGTNLSFSGTVYSADIITLIYSRTSSLTIISEVIHLTSLVPTGATGTQGTNKYFYNTSTNKFEIYTQNQILYFGNLILTLNGITLTNNIDYYQSISNSNRIILNGSIFSGDTLNIVYYPTANVIGGITQNNTPISWNINHVPQLSNGVFTLQASTASTFSAYTITSTVPYVPNVTNYNGLLTLTGVAGTNYYYRVVNIKNYRSIVGDVISSTGYSETVKVVLETNAINSY